jgi:hypothetical protein
MARVYEGWERTVTRVSGGSVTRDRQSHRLALVMLTRLEKSAAGLGADTLVAARLVAREFDVFLDLMETGSGPQITAAFLAERLPKPAEEEQAEESPAEKPATEAREKTRHTPQLHPAVGSDDTSVKAPAGSTQTNEFSELSLVRNDGSLPAPARQAASPAPGMNRAARRAGAAKRRHG